jgi:hypothetical protein
MKKVSLYFMLMLLFVATCTVAPLIIFGQTDTTAQVDTVKAANDSIAQAAADSAAAQNPDDSSSIVQDIIHAVIPLLPEWVWWGISAAIFLLWAYQLYAKIKPTAQSIRIGGWVGKVLDFLTAFVKDRKKYGGVHKK